MNHFETHLMVESQKVHFKLLTTMASYSKNFDEKKQNGDRNSTNFRLFFFKMRFDTPPFKVLVFASDLGF